MWVATRYAATKRPLPDLRIVQKELGGMGGLQYRRLFDEFPDVERGPEETISDHFDRLKAAKQDWRTQDADDAAARRAADPHLQRNQVVEAPKEPAASWVTGPKVNGLPVRDPGWFTGPESTSRGFGVPPMDRRTPGNSLAPSNAPGYAPDQQSMQDWVRWLNSKGITVDHTLQRPDAAQRQVPYRPLTGPEIWQPFVGPSTDKSLDIALHGLPQDMGGLGKSWKQRAKDLFSRRKASVVVTDYIEGILVDLT